MARVLILGGGPAAIEALLAVRADAPRGTRITIAAPNRALRLDALGPAHALGLARLPRYELEPIARGARARLVRGWATVSTPRPAW